MKDTRRRRVGSTVKPSTYCPSSGCHCWSPSLTTTVSPAASIRRPPRGTSSGSCDLSRRSARRIRVDERPASVRPRAARSITRSWNVKRYSFLRPRAGETKPASINPVTIDRDRPSSLPTSLKEYACSTTVPSRYLSSCQLSLADFTPRLGFLRDLLRRLALRCLELYRRLRGRFPRRFLRRALLQACAQRIHQIDDLRAALLGLGR